MQKFCKFPKSKPAARVAVCKDIIKLIQMKKLNISTGNYLTKLNGICEPTFEGIAKECEVCAKGALLLTAFKLYDGKGFAEINSPYGLYDDFILEQLDGLFSRTQLHLIEAVFEGWKDGPTKQFYYDHYNDEDRLLAIMQNIVDHNGTFKPSVRYDVVLR